MTKPEDTQPEKSRTEVGSISDVSSSEINIAGRDIIRAEKVYIGAEPEEPGEAPTPGDPPYMGLQYFDTNDTHLFFGRQALTAKLVERLREQCFLAVVGASGSGKSSLVRAGLVPALQNGDPLPDGTRPPEDSQRWQTRIITPTAHPLKELAACLTSDLEAITATTTLMDDLAKDERCLDIAVSRTLKRVGGERLLLVVDQFEELFTACKDPTERQAFIDNLLYAAADETPGQTILVLTLRADFYHHCFQYDNLRETLVRYQINIGRMSTEELRQAIEEPAKHGDWEFEKGLDDLMLREVGEEPGALPLLSHALLETWKRRRGRTMTLAGYQEAGGVRGAIAHTAEGVYQRLTPDGQAIARNIFLRLTELGEGAQDTRRRATLDEMVTGAEKRPEVEAVLKILADTRLVTTHEDYAEVAHEALIREWPALREWLEEDRESLRLHRHLTEAAQAWERAGRHEGDLYRGLRLNQALLWAGERRGKMSVLERGFLGASRAAQTREIRARQLRWAAIAGAILVGMLVALLGVTDRLDPFIYRPLLTDDDWVAIPAGEFQMGLSDRELALSEGMCTECNFSAEQPQHTVYLDAYRIMKHEVTNRHYAQCVRATLCAPPNNTIYFLPEYADHPVTAVRWQQARDFCLWVGGYLPTEAEWEKAARGGLEEKLYPWGDEFDGSLANFCDRNCLIEHHSAEFDDGYEDTAPVGTYSPNGYGLYDMAGNVYEWVADLYDPEYYQTSSSRNPRGDSGWEFVMRGGSWSDRMQVLRVANRSKDSESAGYWYHGFRCAAMPER